MTLKEALQQASQALAIRHIGDAPQEAQILLKHTLQITQAQLYLQLEQDLTSQQWESFWYLVEQRLQHQPAAYLVGHQEFYGMDFYVDRRVLIPRPESELLVEMALEFARNPLANHPPILADIGTGSGAIALSLAKNLPHARVYATDLSPAALEVAAINRTHHSLTDHVILLQGNLLEPLPEIVDLIVANLPYIKETELEETAPELRFEPLAALHGGPDGLEQIRLLLQQAQSKGQPRGCLLIEIGQGQAARVKSLARGYFPQADFEMRQDPCGIERVVNISLRQTRP
ncbi:peptide chain release factor N(5)-glutamine methyltransferase [Chloroflexota bacterium]